MLPTSILLSYPHSMIWLECLSWPVLLILEELYQAHLVLNPPPVSSSSWTLSITWATWQNADSEVCLLETPAVCRVVWKPHPGHTCVCSPGPCLKKQAPTSLSFAPTRGSHFVIFLVALFIDEFVPLRGTGLALFVFLFHNISGT